MCRTRVILKTKVPKGQSSSYPRVVVILWVDIGHCFFYLGGAKMRYSMTRATVSTKPRFLTLFKVHLLCFNKGTSRLLNAPHINHSVWATTTLMFGSLVKVSKKCQKSWFSGNGSVRRAVKSVNVKYELLLVAYLYIVFYFDLWKGFSIPFSALCCHSCHDEWRHGVVEWSICGSALVKRP